jgi:hypothetical protein
MKVSDVMTRKVYIANPNHTLIVFGDGEHSHVNFSHFPCCFAQPDH